MLNFEFLHNGKTYWYSRAVVCVSAVFCKDKKGRLYILLNKRGTATNNELHKWNMPVGYLDFNETTTECAAREIFEETGVKVPLNKLKLYNINSKPDSGNQDIGFRYYCLLDGNVEDYKFSLDNMETNEVENVIWLNIDKLDILNFAWNHKDIIKDILKNKFSDYINE